MSCLFFQGQTQTQGHCNQIPVLIIISKSQLNANAHTLAVCGL